MLGFVAHTTLSRRLFCAGLAAGAAGVAVRGTREWLASDLDPSREAEIVRALARGVVGWTRRDLGPADFATGSRRFSGEWAFGTLMMAAMGLGQLAHATPSLRSELCGSMERLVDMLLEKESRAFSRDAWGSDPLDGILDPRPASSERLDGHAAYLGYLNLAVGLLRALEPSTRHAELGALLTEALEARHRESAIGLVATYPGETYPVDNAAALASIHLGNAAMRRAPTKGLQRGLRAVMGAIDPKTGLLAQAVDGATGDPRDRPRGSGTCLAVYFLSFVDKPLSSMLWQAAKRELVGRVLGFRVVREHPRGALGGADIDSGPVVFGYGVSASGFALGASRIHGDEGLRRDLYATASLLGAPTRVRVDSPAGAPADGLRFVTGGPLGDALLLAMLTASKEPVHRRYDEVELT